MTSAQLLTISVDIGKALLESGAEISRVEESIFRICAAYDAHAINVYAVPTAIITSFSREDDSPFTRVCRIHQRGTNLGRLDQLNALCRDICANPTDYKTIREQLELILRHSSYAGWQLCIATGGVGFFFTLLFGGGPAEAACAFVSCLLLWLLTTGMRKINANPLFINVIGGFWVALSGLLCYHFGWIPAYGTMIVGSIMFLVPGLPITNAIRDLIAGDSIAGITKFTEALLVAAGIAVGAALPLSFVGYFGG